MIILDMTTMLSSVGQFFTSAMEWLVEALETVNASPALLIMVVAIPVAGVAIGYLKRLISL